MLRYAVMIMMCVALILVMGMDLPQTKPEEGGLVQERAAEIIIKVKPGTIVMPEGDFKAQLSEIEIKSDALNELNTKFNLIGIERVFKGKEEAAGEGPTELDLKNTFLFKFPGPTDLNEVIKEYGQLEEVIYAEENKTLEAF